MDTSAWAEKLITNHKNPLVRFEVNKTKLFVPKNKDEEDKLVEDRIKVLRNILQSVRVERRCARNKINWLPERNLGLLEHSVKSKFWHMGFHNKTGKFVYPEEALFLLETNRADIFWNKVPITIYQAYSILLNDGDCLAKYNGYRMLSLRGLTMKRMKSLEETQQDSPPTKKPKISEEEANEGDCNAARDIFTRLQSIGPKYNREVVEKNADYTFDLKNEKYSVHFVLNNELDTRVGFYTNSGSHIFCNVGNETLLTQIVSVELPSLF